MEAPKQEEIKNVEPAEEEEEEEEEMTGKNKTVLNEKLINCVKKNEYEQAQKCIKRKADLTYEENNKKKWTAFIWACCLGHTRMVKLLLSKGAAANYLELKPENKHVVLGSTKQTKPNPLHWACFKNNLDVMQILLKTGLHWEDVDSCGNNSVMLSAAGNAPEIFKKFLQFGVLLDCKNSRGHTVKDLTTNPQILALTANHDKTLACSVSKSPFKEKQIKFWCWVCQNFSNESNFRMEWVLKDLNVAEKEIIDGRCIKCWGIAEKMKNELQQAMKVYEENRLRHVLQQYKAQQNQIQITFLNKCEKLLHKLNVQNQILSYIKSLAKVQNYKVILKSVNKIHQMLKDAQPISIDQNVIEAANKEIHRLNAERNLRYEIDNIDTSVATREGVAKLEEVYSDAQTKSVSSDYLSVAGTIKQKMNKSILAQDLYQMFVDYPQRPDPYPSPLVIDFKTKKPLDPETKKPTDPVNLLPKKKKGKKQVKFAVPEWANELKELNEKIKQEEHLLTRRQELGLSPQFCKKAEQIIVVMKQESRYRKDIDTLQAMVDEATKKKK